MALFNSIWGDLKIADDKVATIEPTVEPTVETVKPVEIPEPKDTKEEIVEKPEDTSKKEQPKVSDDKDKSKDVYEFTEDDVEKAYTMLAEEGVIELGEDDELDVTPKGIADAVAITVRNKFQKELDSIPGVVQEFYNHIVEGKDVTSFVSSVKEVEWNDLDIEEESSQDKILLESYIRQGMTKEEAEEELTDITDDAKKLHKAEIAKKLLVKTQTTNRENAKNIAKKATDDEEANRLASIDKLKETIDSTDEIASFKLTTENRTAFKKYLFDINPRTGKTQMQENMINEDRRMKIAFLDFIDFNKTDIEKGITTKLTKLRRKRLTKFSDKNISNKNNSVAIKTKNDAKQGKIVYPTLFGKQTIEIED